MHDGRRNDPVATGSQACTQYAMALALILSMTAAPALADGGTPTIGQLKQLNVEDLMNVEVTSVARHPEKLLDSASAIQVITQEDIRRSGATSIPEALRLADNLQVAQKNSHDWAISARGFNTDLAQQALGHDRWAHRIYAVVFGRVLGRARLPARRYRSHRGHQRPGRRPMGCECRQRRDQYHHEERQGHPGLVRGPWRRFATAGFCRRALRRSIEHGQFLPCLRQIL